MSRNDANIKPKTKDIRNLDLEFEIQAERQARSRNVKGEEFDTIIEEIRSILETVQLEIKVLNARMDTHNAWLKEAARHI